MRIRICLLKDVLENEYEKNIVCWGVGKRFLGMCDLFGDKFVQKKIRFLIDNDVNKIGKDFEIGKCKKNVITGHEADKRIKKDDILVISCLKYWDVLRQIALEEIFLDTQVIIYPLIGHEFSVNNLLLKNRWLESFMHFHDIQTVNFFQVFFEHLYLVSKLNYTKLVMHFLRQSKEHVHFFFMEEDDKKEEWIGHWFIDSQYKYDNEPWMKILSKEESDCIFSIVLCEEKKYIIEKFDQSPNIYVNSKNGTLIVIDGYSNKWINNINIFVVAHKAFIAPKENIYKIIYVGDFEEKKQAFNDYTGDNIAGLNEKINECTALYWIWKNCRCQYVGLNHYRRYFCDWIDSDRIVTNYTLNKLLKRFDFIVAQKEVFHAETVYQQLKSTLQEKVFEIGYYLIKKSIGKNQPEYLNEFNRVFNGNEMYPCNMFITSKKNCDKYCEWLFSIIIEVANEINVDDYDSYNKRVIGFFAERLLTVWLNKQNLRLVELPIQFVEQHI